MLKFYFNGSPNPSKVALFLEEAGPALPAHSGRHAQGRTIQAGVHGHQSRTARCRSSTMTASSCSIATRSCCISPRRPASFCLRTGPPAAARCCRG